MAAGTTKRRRVILVTGATTGIGLALARQLLTHHFRVVLSARSASLGRFQELGIEENEHLWLRPIDLTKADEADTVIAEIDRQWGGVDVLVNNAGVCYRAVIEQLTDQDEDHQFHVNYFGPLHLIRSVLPGMRARRRGHIINLSSVGGMMAMPTLGGYSASKFALEGASEALWYELRPWNIHVTLIEPGFVHSNSFQNAYFTEQSRKALTEHENPYHQYYRNLMALIERMMRLSPTTPDDIARMVIKTMNKSNPPLRISATWDAVFFTLIRRLLPKRLYHSILYRGLPNIKQWVRPIPAKDTQPSQNSQKGPPCSTN